MFNKLFTSDNNLKEKQDLKDNCLGKRVSSLDKENPLAKPCFSISPHSKSTSVTNHMFRRAYLSHLISFTQGSDVQVSSSTCIFSCMLECTPLKEGSLREKATWLHCKNQMDIVYWPEKHLQLLLITEFVKDTTAPAAEHCKVSYYMQGFKILKTSSIICTVW